MRIAAHVNCYPDATVSSGSHVGLWNEIIQTEEAQQI